MSVGEICNRDVIVISENDSIHEAARRMRAHHAGALVVTAHGGLAGVVAMDDMPELFAEELVQLSRIVAREQAREMKMRP